MLCLCSAVDPRFKALPFLSTSDREYCERQLQREIIDMELDEANELQSDEGMGSVVASSSNTLQEHDPVVCSSSTKTSKLENVLDMTLYENMASAKAVDSSLKARVEAELAAFKLMPVIPMSESPIEWWKLNFSRFPRIGMLSKRLLTIPGSSVPSERVFSAAGELISAKRNRLNPENVNMLLFLHENCRD